jgi:hypothetical protein
VISVKPNVVATPLQIVPDDATILSVCAKDLFTVITLDAVQPKPSAPVKV